MTTKAHKDDLIEMFLAGVAAADPVRAVDKALTDAPIQAVTGRLILLAIGKAAHGMLQAAMDHAPHNADVTAIAVTNYENHREIAGVQCFAAGHPVPDENGIKAGQAVRALLDGVGAEDHVLALISGGGSALLPGPVEGLSLDDKAAVNQLLLATGADIEETNIVRQGLSLFKGGGLLRLAAPASVRSLILSDVIGDDLRVIASGPTVAPIADRQRGIEILNDLGVWEDVPPAAREVLSSEQSRSDLPRSNATLVGSNGLSLAAMAEASKRRIEKIDTPLDGPVTQAARRVVDAAMAAPRGTILAFGGETTVVLTGDGRGGRNQELALRVALLAEHTGLAGDWMFLSGGTDGRDGPTDAAGAIVDQGSLSRMRQVGIEPEARLANSDSYAALQASGDLLMIGATGTNVADLQLFLKL